MTKIKELAKGGFTNQEKIIKFLFLIHNNNTKVREYLIDKAEPSKTSYDFLVLAKTIQSQTQTETVVMRNDWEVYSVSCIGVLPFIEGSLGDSTSGLVAVSHDSTSEEHA